jgi:predicted aconitase
MYLTREEEKMLNGEYGEAVRKSMEILMALGDIYGADKLISVSSVQVAGVSYDNLGDAGLEYLADLAKDGRVRVLTTLNPAGMDLENWRNLGISEDFAKKQIQVIESFRKMGITTSCTCTPYLIGNLPRFGEHVAWSESSAVAFVNSVIGAKTNREGGPSALAAALTGRTPNYGMHLDKNRQAEVVVNVKTKLKSVPDFGALGYVIGNSIKNKIPYITSIKSATLEQLKSFSASIATYGGTAIFHIKGITPNKTKRPKEKIEVIDKDIKEALAKMNDPDIDPDFVSIGCPHASIREIESIAQLLKGKHVKVETWIATARPTKQLADMMGYTKIIEEAGAKFACDTCMVVAPLKGRFKCLATDSAKSCFYARGKNNFKVKIGTLEECIDAAITGKWKR